MNNSVPSPVFLSLAEIIRGLRVAVAAWGGRRVLGTLLVLELYRRIGEIGRRISGMAARFASGRVRRRAVPVRTRVVRRRAAPRVLPVRFGWLVQAVGYEAAGFGCQLRAVLETPDMAALLAASPEAVRVLRPLCRALAIETVLLRPRAVKRVDPAPVDAAPMVVPNGVVPAVCGVGMALG